MGTTTMSFALPETLRAYIDERVRQGDYGNTSEYLRDLVRRDQQEQARQALRDLIEQGLRSGEGRPVTTALAAQLKKRALGRRR